MKSKMILTTTILLAGFLVSLHAFVVTKNSIVETIMITIGVTLYHFVMRLVVGTIINFIMKNKANHNSVWFREKKFENKFYRLMRVRDWKKYLPTYSPETFDTSEKTIMEIVGATCQAEVIHEVIMLFSLLPICLIPFLGGAPALIITSILSMMIDAMFVMLQRYNRPRLVRVMERFQKIKNNEQSVSKSNEINA